MTWPISLRVFPPTPVPTTVSTSAMIFLSLGSTSSAVSGVVTARTPQLMSTPTAPGETTASGSRVSTAMTPPMGRP